MNDVILFFEMSRYINNEDKIRCPKCVLFEKKGISGTEFPSNITRQISAKVVDSDECEKAKTVNTSTCNEARFWCKELVWGPGTWKSRPTPNLSEILISFEDRILPPGPGPTGIRLWIPVLKSIWKIQSNTDKWVTCFAKSNKILSWCRSYMSRSKQQFDCPKEYKCIFWFCNQRTEKPVLVTDKTFKYDFFPGLVSASETVTGMLVILWWWPI